MIFYSNKKIYIAFSSHDKLKDSDSQQLYGRILAVKVTYRQLWYFYSQT